MASLSPSMQLKVKRDTFYIPDETGAVYFHNNQGSFRMEGRTIAQWIEKLLPVLDGSTSLADLTDGLPGQYRDQVYEIAEVLYNNGYLKDVSQDRRHELPADVALRFSAQIEFLDNFVESAEYRFQQYRQANVLVIGSGAMLLSSVTALLESGLPKINVAITDSVPTNRPRLLYLADHAFQSDADVALIEVPIPAADVNWREVIRPFDWILFVSEDGCTDVLRALHAICRHDKKGFLPASCIQGVGIAGPLIHPDAMGGWESAWRRIHQPLFDNDLQLHTFSSTAGAMLVNVLVFELFKAVTGVSHVQPNQPFYLLNLETLEGAWHGFLPHPLVEGYAAAKPVPDVQQLLVNGTLSRGTAGLLQYFGLLTSPKSGIFHTWEEGELTQLPLPQCRVQTVDPLSEGPARLMPDRVGTGLTHEEARREAGLMGVEAYVSRLVSHRVPLLEEGLVGIGAGETVVEAVSRGLHKCLAATIKPREDEQPYATKVHLAAVDDQHCQFYLQALTTMHGTPLIALGDGLGFPVVWVRTAGRWHGSVGLNETLALRRVLQQAVMVAQNKAEGFSGDTWEVPSIYLIEREPASLLIPACADLIDSETLRAALLVLEQNGKQVDVLDLALEPFLKEELAGVYGVALREEGFQWPWCG